MRIRGELGHAVVDDDGDKDSIVPAKQGQRGHEARAQRSARGYNTAKTLHIFCPFFSPVLIHFPVYTSFEIHIESPEFMMLTFLTKLEITMIVRLYILIVPWQNCKQ